MEERRRMVRLRTAADVTYTRLPDGVPQPGRTGDVSLGGCCLSTEAAAPIGAQFQISLRVPGREQPVNAVADVAWSQAYQVTEKSSQRRAADVGLRFVEIAPTDFEALEKFVAGSLRAL